MGARSTRFAALHSKPGLWYETDALFAWLPQASDTGATITPTRGGALTQSSAAPATGYVAASEYDMTNGVYTGSAGMTAIVDSTMPYLVAVAIDKNTQSTTYQVAMELHASYNIQFDSGNGAPRFHHQMNGLTPAAQACIATWPSAGTVAIYWTYCNPAAGTIDYGNNQNTFTTQSGLTVPANGFSGRNFTLGAGFSSTTNVSHLKHGATQCVGNRSGASALTKAQALAIVQKMQNLYGV